MVMQPVEHKRRSQLCRLRRYGALAMMLVLVLGASEQPPDDIHVANPHGRSDTAERAGLAGSTSCRECHKHFYQLWAPSHHGLAMQPFTRDFARDHLTPHNEQITIGQHRYRYDDGHVVETGPNDCRKLPIAHVLGGKNVFYFLTPSERGRLQTLPLAYNVRQGTWFDTAASGMRHVPGRPDDEPLHWTDREYTFNTSCYSCHVSQLSTNFDLVTDTYNTTWAEPGINCETCHGPAAEHARVCKEAGPGEPPQDLKIFTVSQSRGFSADRVNDSCAPCHARMMPIAAFFQPGERFFDHYDLTTLEHPDFYPDGRDLGENYTYTLWRMSPCLQDSTFDCLHCHTSSGRFRFQDEPNRSCLPCHAERVANPTEHTHHTADSTGSICINCHMPKTEFANMVRSDHSLLPPTPATTIAFESPNACNLCHADQDAKWADEFIREWHTTDYQTPVLHRAGLIKAARDDDWTRLPEMTAYILDPQSDEIFTASLVRLLWTCGDDRARETLVRALDNRSPLVRAAAAAALEQPVNPDIAAALLKAAGDDYRLVRVRAAASLAGLPRNWTTEGQWEQLRKATDEFIAAMNSRLDDHAGHYNLGNFLMSWGQFEAAVGRFETAVKLQPRDVAPLVNASLAYNALGRNEEAERSLRAALKRDPKNVAAHLNLGLLLAEINRLPEAETALRRALAEDPTLAQAAFNLGVILAADRLPEALTWCRKACALQPDNARYAYTQAFYEHQAGHSDEAVSLLHRLLEQQPDYADAYGLLGKILESQGKRAEAAAVYRQAADNADLPAQVRQFFHARLEALEQR